ncbi:hypothetical protein [Crenobacter cavernae]|nr:hypothetical protein [Crenobacter cavernae]
MVLKVDCQALAFPGLAQGAAFVVLLLFHLIHFPYRLIRIDYMARASPNGGCGPFLLLDMILQQISNTIPALFLKSFVVKSGQSLMHFERLVSLLPYAVLFLAAFGLGRSLMAPFAAPTSRAVGLPDADPALAAAQAAAAHWFGDARQAAPAAAAPAGRLIGMWAPQGASGGFAIIEDGGQRHVLTPGKALPSGWILAGFDASGALLTLGGAESRLVIERAAGAPGEPAAAPQALDAPSAQMMAPAAPVGPSEAYDPNSNK